MLGPRKIYFSLPTSVSVLKREMASYSIQIDLQKYKRKMILKHQQEFTVYRETSRAPKYGQIWNEIYRVRDLKFQKL